MKIKAIIILLFLLSKNFTVSGQGIDNLWMMGYQCCTTYFHPMNLNFISGSLTIDTVRRTMNMNCTNGQICNKNGNLLFYTNGIYIANSLDDTMQNGDNLNPSWFTNIKSFNGLTIPQANLIIPYPDDSTKYYLFHETSDDANVTWSAFYLYYSVIDMSLDSGLGAVVQKNVVLLNDTLVVGRLTASKHANGRDWWLVAPEYLTGNVFKFLITPQGIQGAYIQSLQTSRSNYNLGQAVFSEQGNKFAYYEPQGGLDIFDYDRCTGDFSNQIHIVTNDSANSGGVAFSPSGQFLYVSSMRYVYQLDLWSTDIAASKITVAVWDSTYAPWQPFATFFYLAALAPDNKVYINCSNGTTVLHVINFPDSAGTACDFCQNCIQLPAFNGFTMPNHPNYFLGAETGSICDSLHIGISDPPKFTNAFHVFPNPARNVLYITQSGTELIQRINIFNSIGQQWAAEYSSIKNGEYVEVNTSALASGIYFLEMLTDKQKIVKRFIKQ